MSYPANPFSLKGKTALITGGAGLLGRAFGKTFAEAGARVVLLDIISQKDLDARVHELLPYAQESPKGLRLDITDEKAVQKTVQLLARELGSIDILVNNAAMNPSPGSKESKAQWMPYEKYPTTLWEKELHVGLTGTFIMTKAVTPFMRSAKQGSIINISSIYGLSAPRNEIYEKNHYKSIAYATVKGALVNFTRAWASYAGKDGVRVNTLTLGGVMNNQPKPFMKRYAAYTMLGRMGKAEEAAHALLFLASDASSYVTGSNLIVDGGWSAR